MFASLLRHARRPRAQRSPFSSPFSRPRQGNDHDNGLTEGDESSEGYHLEDEDEPDHEQDPLLPLFSSELLDRLPVYHTTHAIRILVIQRCETTLSWDQLRSPQVSQFLVKPIQQQVRGGHFSRATLYALIANGLQFQKESQLDPGNVGVSRTRALICELLAIRLLKEYSTRELIDSLFYDFDPMQGMLPPPGSRQALQRPPRPSPSSRTARISTVEIAIRAQAKKFLSHPLVVRQLEAVWAGNIVFHSAADHLHRKPLKPGMPRTHSYGAISQEDPDPTPTKARPSTTFPTRRRIEDSQDLQYTPLRRSVTLYDPRDASLFKLSRLRVPRYRQMFSTLSFAVMLGLFLAVLVQQSLDITGLEILFWFWSAGYMLDEIVGFTEQGFGLYIMSVWNAFDLGILLLFVVYYVLRLYGIIMPDVRRQDIAYMAYDVLASTAVLLFPRLFSVLDHYRYFSQLLIAFRMMALDLVAVLLLIVISCSGFFVAFTLAFSDRIPDAPSAAYALFQMLMGFTPAAWDIWGGYNLLGKGILVLFLFICHFLIVTILITVLTNSFMSIVQNANEEHQFLFAVNTISMVKSDALFSYIAPTNIVGWLLTPTRYVLPLRRYVRMNRMIIKVTHLPILLTIFTYERLILSQRAYEPTDLVEQRGRSASKLPAFSMRGPNDLFSPGHRLREPSVTTFQKDRALEEVFRRPFRDTMRRTPIEDDVEERRKSSNVVRDWMQGMGQAGPAPPVEQSRLTIDRLESRRRPLLRRAPTAQRVPPGLVARRSAPRKARSETSDRGEARLSMGGRRHSAIEDAFPSHGVHDPQQTDADGDDELLTNDEDERGTAYDRTGVDDDSKRSPKDRSKTTIPEEPGSDSDEEFFSTPMPHRPHSPTSGSLSIVQDMAYPDQAPSASANPRRRMHNRNPSTSTILYSPLRVPPSQRPVTSLQSASPPKRSMQPRPQTARSGVATPSGRKTPKRPPIPHSNTTANIPTTRPRPIVPPRLRPGETAPSFAAHLLGLNSRDRIPSFSAQALDLASDLGDNRHGPDPISAMPASFSTQLEAALARQRHGAAAAGSRGSGDDLANRIMLARMGALEETFREVVREVKEMRREGEESRMVSRIGSKAASKAGSKGSSLMGDPEIGGLAGGSGSGIVAAARSKKGKKSKASGNGNSKPGSASASFSPIAGEMMKNFVEEMKEEREHEHENETKKENDQPERHEGQLPGSSTVEN